jgi:hypothetical protein
LEKTFRALSAPFGDVSGFGELAWIALQVGEEGETQLFKGPLTLIDLKGRLRRAGDVLLADYVCTVSRLTDNGVQVLGGKLKEAEVIYLELTFTPLVEGEAAQVETQKAEMGAPAASNRPAAHRPAAPASEKSALPDRWAKAVLESKRVERDSILDDGASDVRPRTGDIVQHRQFGECKVTRIGDDHVTLRKPDGRHVQLGLPILRFTTVGEQEGKTVYSVKVRAKR